GGALLKNSRDAMNFVYPKLENVPSFGKEPFTELIVKKSKKRDFTSKQTKYIETTSYSLPKDLAQEISDLDGLKKYSCKFAKIIKIILKYPQESVYVHSEFVTRSGAILFSLVLEQYGFIKTTKSFKITDKTEKKPRFVIFTSDPFTISHDRD